MLMNPGLRKFALTAHITTSVGWLGAVVGFLAHAIASMLIQDAEMVRSAYFFMELTLWYVLLPLCVASFVTGLIQSLGTKWGLFRHYWVLVKFLLTAFATIILLTFMRGFNLPTVETAASGMHSGGAASPVVHAAGGLVVLLAAVVLSVFKPWGKTRYGRSKHLEI